MPKNTEKQKLKKGKSYFTITGALKLKDNTFTIDKTSDSGYQYSRLNLQMEAGAGNVIFAEAMGGFFPNKDSKIYSAQKEDITKAYEIDWEDRFDDEILEKVHPMKFIKIGIKRKEVEQKEGEDKKKGELIVKKFLSWYDAIEYLDDHLETGMNLTINGQLKYSIYNDKVQVKKEVNSIFLAYDDAVHGATFTQSLLIDQYAIGTLDKETNEYPIYAKVLDYTKLYNGKEVKTTIPFPLTLYVPKETEKMNPELIKKFLKKFFKVKKGVDEVVMEGIITNGSQTSEVTEADIPDDMQELIDMGLYTKEDILKKLVVRGGGASRMIITKPHVTAVEKDGQKVPQFIQNIGRYTEDDLLLDFMNEDAEEDAPWEKETDEETKKDDGKAEEPKEDDWLNDLD